MKKRKQSRIVLLFKRIFNFRQMADVDRAKSAWDYIVNIFRRLFIPQNRVDGGSSESFEQAVSDMNLTEEQLTQRKTALWRLSCLMLCLFGLVFMYSFYNLLYGSWPGFYLSLVVSLLAMVLAFRYHFWYFQIAQRKLGCTFREWFRQGLLGER